MGVRLVSESLSSSIEPLPPRESIQMSRNSIQERDNDEPTGEEIRLWMEFACWTTLVMAPIINWLNGPAVSDDQYVVRTGLIVFAACGGIGFRLSAWLRC
jgi:hypothetical protein